MAGKGRFDVVIGNPPYKIEYDLKLKATYEQLYFTFKKEEKQRHICCVLPQWIKPIKQAVA